MVTGSFVIAAVGAFYALRGLHPEQSRVYLRAGVLIGLVASLLVAFPTGDEQAKMVGYHQPVTLAAMEGRFTGGRMAGVSVIGEPDVKHERLENPIEIPGSLSFLAYGTFESSASSPTARSKATSTASTNIRAKTGPTTSSSSTTPFIS